MVWEAVADNEKWDLVHLSIPSSEVAEKGKGMNSTKRVNIAPEGPLKRAARSMHIQTWGEVLVAEDRAPCPTCKLAKGARKELGIKSCVHSPH
jgi:hypothetical protein